MADPSRDRDRQTGARGRPRGASAGREMAYHRLLEALAQPGCPICSLRTAAVARYLEGLLYEHVNDVQLRETLVRSRGFCAPHAWELVGFNDSLGTAILYRDQVAQALDDVRYARGHGQAKGPAGGQGGRAARLIRERRAPQVLCPACRIADEATGRYLSALVQHLDGPEIRAGVKTSPFLCLPDAVRALEISGDPAKSSVLLEIVEAKLARLHGDLAELIRKRDYRFAHEPQGAEQTSWFRAVGHLVGWRPAPRRE
jgi:hypothetical protein